MRRLLLLQLPQLLLKERGLESLTLARLGRCSLLTRRRRLPPLLCRLVYHLVQELQGAKRLNS